MQLETGEGGVVAFVSAAVVGLAGWIWRNRTRSDDRLDKVAATADAKIDRVAAELAAHRVEVIQTRASIDYVAAVERRAAEGIRELKGDVLGRLEDIAEGMIRLENKLDAAVNPRAGGRHDG